MTAVLTFTCSICGEASQDICVYCTKDTCENHMCQKCRRCSDCCVCETPVLKETPERTLPEELVPEDPASEYVGGNEDVAAREESAGQHESVHAEENIGAGEEGA